MKQYLLSIYYPPGATQPAPEALTKIMQEVSALNEEMKASGAWVFAAGLHDPSTATVVQYRNGEALMTDGPFAEGKEQLGGFTIVAAPDLDAALTWGRKLAKAVTVPVEVRPLQDGHC